MVYTQYFQNGVYLFMSRLNDRMVFDLKNRPFVSATFHRSRRTFVPEANVAAIGQPKMAYLDVETKS